ncbi:hypothetical protein PIB30_062475 [Stylosanthes scabra]|uniref:Uncharacterized protein n=1 Tax=Stylosanthes scabra TaxID=79078 RepID=A0ABU6ZJW1_9FABA|nr:hypothetical protein [Stylosanthes scabra]
MAQVLGNLVTAGLTRLPIEFVSPGHRSKAPYFAYAQEVLVTAGYSWEPGAESRTSSNNCSNNDRSPILGILVALCDTSFENVLTQPARDKAEFGAEVLGESERNEMFATNLKGHCWSLCVPITWSHAYASERGQHAQLLISAPMRTHMKPPCVRIGQFQHL